MRFLRRFLARLKNFAMRRRADQRLGEEIEEHLALQTAENLRAGMAPAEARRKAVLRFGAVEAIREGYHAEQGLPLIEILLQDMRYAFRLLAKSPGLTVVAVLTMALGVGATTAIFSIVNAALLEPLPFHHPEQLVELSANFRGQGAQNVGFSVPELEDLRDRAGIFTSVSAVWQAPVNLTGGDHPERLEFLAVSPNYFSILGAQPQLGRLFDGRDTADGFAEAVVISDGLWHKEFGADHSIIGRRVRLDNDLYTIVGVLPPRFRPPSSPSAHPVDIWAPAGFRALPFPAPRRSDRLLPGIIARLKPGITLQRAQAQLAVLSDTLRRDYGSDYPSTAGWTLSITPLKEVVVGNARTLLISLLMAVALILLIACVNVANLLLAKACARQPEIALRMALGATRARIIRQLLTESALLSLISAAVGAGAAAIGVRVLVAVLPSQLPRLNPIGVDARVLVFSLTIALVTTVLFGLMPALQASKTQPGTADLQVRSGSATRRATKLGKTLIGAEAGLSLMLLVAAGLLLRTFWNLLQVDPGFNSHHLVGGSIWLPYPNDPTADLYHKPEQRTVLVREVIRRLRGLPGVDNAAFSSVVPLQGPILPYGFRVEGAPEQGDSPTAVQVSVTPEFFQTIGIPLIRGRLIEKSDSTTSPLVALVDEGAARHFWGDRDPIGRRIRFAKDSIFYGEPKHAPWMTVVGVVGNAKLSSLDEKDVPHVYCGMYQFSGREFAVLVRATGDKATLTREVQQSIQSVDPDLPISEISEMTDSMSTGMGDRRFAAWLLAAFALVALLLTSVGVYGVSSYAIVRREKEIGIRSALGASSGRLVYMVLRDGMVPVLVGLAAGSIAAAFFGRLLAALLFNVKSGDAMVFASAGITLIAIGIIANYLPARRAARIDPITAMRVD
jgi:predicted permease